MSPVDTDLVALKDIVRGVYRLHLPAIHVEGGNGAGMNDRKVHPFRGYIPYVSPTAVTKETILGGVDIQLEILPGGTAVENTRVVRLVCRDGLCPNRDSKHVMGLVHVQHLGQVIPIPVKGKCTANDTFATGNRASNSQVSDPLDIQCSGRIRGIVQFPVGKDLVCQWHANTGKVVDGDFGL